MSGYVAETLRQQRAAEPGAEVWRGTIATTPATDAEPVMVTLPAFAPDLQLGPCRWTLRYTPVLVNVAESGESAHNVEIPQKVMPQRGDRCLVAFDENAEPYVLGYWSA